MSGSVVTLHNVSVLVLTITASCRCRPGAILQAQGRPRGVRAVYPARHPGTPVRSLLTGRTFQLVPAVISDDGVTGVRRSL
jgi:hypothetical protein